MLEYLQKYNTLPQDLRQSLASPGIISAVHNLETKYKISLALVVIKAAIGEFSPENIKNGLVTDLKLSVDTAGQLSADLAQSVFFVLPNFKAVAMTKPATVPELASVAQIPVVKELSAIDLRVLDVIKKAKIDLASQALMDRLKQVLRTYILGVRDNLAVMDALTKPFEFGGLAFSQAVSEELIKIADGKESLPTKINQSTRPSLPVSFGSSRDIDYDLMSSLKSKGVTSVNIDPLANESRLAKQQSSGSEIINKNQAVPGNLPWQGAVVPEKAITPRQINSSVAPAPLTAVKVATKQVEPSVELANDNKDKEQTKTVLSKASPIIKLATTVAEQNINEDVFVSPQSAVVPSVPQSNLSQQPQQVSVPIPIPVPKTIVARPASVNQPTIIKQTTMTGETSKPIDKFTKTESGTIKMDDIHFTPRVFSPIDELKYMTLKNFRNLNPDPAAAAQMIKQKIETLAKDDFSWKLEGITAWKQSPVNKMYVDIYHTAMSEGKQIAEIISAKQANGGDALSSAEFEAIFSFNQEISLYK